MKSFNTSGPNIIAQHYTVERELELNQGVKLVKNERYFTIWAPRQTGKSTYFRQLAKKLELEGYLVAHINFENYKDASLSSFLSRFIWKLQEFWNLDVSNETEISKISNNAYLHNGQSSTSMMV